MLQSVYSPSNETLLKEQHEHGVEFHLVTLDVPRLDIKDCETASTRSSGASKSLALITFLAFAPRRTASRDALCDLLWGDRSLNQSRPQLRQTLWLIKTQIHPELVQADADAVSLSSRLTSDADAFVSAIERDALSEAIAIYASDFFGGYGAPGAGRFEEWGNSERVRLRGLFLNSAETLGRRALNSGRFQDAVALARRMRTADPNGQAGWRLQLEARIAAGDSIGARADADHLENWLRAEEWDAEPETSAAIRTARRVAEPNGDASRSNELVAELVGREKEFSVLHDAWLSAKSEGARFMHVAGESGLGKTRLITDVFARIRAARGKVRYVRANFAERAIPFSFAAAVAESLASASGAGGIAPSAVKTLVSLNPALSSQFASPAGDTERLEPLRVGLAILDLISSVADENPIAIALDDLHWCDVQSREALTVAASRLSDEKVLLLSSSRPQYSAGPLRHESPVVRLNRLSCDDVTAFLTSLARLPETSLADSLPSALCESTDGVPLRVLEALRFCIDAGLLVRAGEQWSCPDDTALLHALDASATVGRRLSSLSPAESEILSLIGIGGMPIPRNLIIEASGHQSSVAEQTVAGLELRGLVVTERDSWAPAHDSIAEALVANADRDGETLRACHLRLGTAMLASPDPEWKKRALPHLAEAKRWKEVAIAVTPYLRGNAATSTGVRLAIASLIGSPDASDSVSRIIAELPLLVRNIGLVRRVAFVGIPLIALLAAFALPALRDSTPKPGTVLVSLTRTPDGNTVIKETRLDINRWDASSPIAFESTKHVTGWLGDHMIHATPRPGTESWAIYSVYPDSGDGEIDLIDITGERTRLTHSRHDDRPMSFSPDGRQLLFSTTRWNSNGWSDVATIDMSTGRVRRISNGHAKYDAPMWSPDGTRFVYDGPNGFCVVDADGSHSNCPGVPGWSIAGHLGWIDDHRILISGRTTTVNTVRAVYDLDRGTVSETALAPRDDIGIDPTATWAISAAKNDGQLEDKISPTTRFDLARVIHQNSTLATKVAFLVPQVDGAFLDSVAIAAPHQPLAVGVPQSLKARGWTKQRDVVSPQVARWRSLTPDIAEVDSLGILVGTKPGFALIELSAGGWRKAVATVEIRAAEVKTPIEESWGTAVNDRWRVFGNPSPKLVRNDGITAFLNNGDDNFFSGAYMRRRFDARDGVAMDLDISTPINNTQWQLIIAGLQPWAKSTWLDEWDHKTGYMIGDNGGEQGCWVNYPFGEGKGNTTRSPWYRSMLLAVGNPSFRIDTGKWYRVRLQIFPDGRCGMAINGRSVVIGQGRGPLTSPVLPIIEGMSVGTRILVGHVKIISGVPSDVDWTGLSFDGSTWTRQAPVAH